MPRSFDTIFKIEAIKFAESHSVESTARQFQVDPKTIRDWKKHRVELERLMRTKPNRKRRAGGGMKIVSQDLEDAVNNWILTQKSKNLKVSRKMIQEKAREIYSGVKDGRVGHFTASKGWIEKFLKRNGYFLGQDYCVESLPFKLFGSQQETNVEQPPPSSPETDTEGHDDAFEDDDEGIIDMSKMLTVEMQEYDEDD